jgi:hypothetical protein
MIEVDGKQIYPGFYEGVVEAIDAPATEPDGSVRVRVPDIHGSVTDVRPDQLPWAEPNFMFAGSFCGVVGIPPLNARVHVIFKHGDKKYPMWIGGGYRTAEIPAEYTAGKAGLIPNVWLWRTPTGYTLIFNELEKSVTLKTPTGFQVVLDDTLLKSSVSTPTGYSVNLDETQQKAEMVTPSMQSIALNEAAGEASLTGTAKAIITAVLVELGLGASQSILIGELFAAFYDAHTHPSPAGGATGAPVIPMTPSLAALSSATVKIRP